VVQNIKSCISLTGMYQCTMTSFLGAFTKLLKPTISLAVSLCPLVLLSLYLFACNNSAPIGWIFMTFDLREFLEKSAEEFQI